MKKLLFLLLLVPAILQAQIPVDKQYHIGAGAVIGVWGTFMGNSLELSPEKSALVGFGCAVAAGVGKELWDVSDQWFFGIEHPFDCRDIVATAAGGVVGAGLSYIILKYVDKHKKPEKVDDSLYFYFGANTVQGGIKINF